VRAGRLYFRESILAPADAPVAAGALHAGQRSDSAVDSGHGVDRVYPVDMCQNNLSLRCVAAMQLRGGEMPDLSGFAAIRPLIPAAPRLPWTGTM